MKAVRLIGCAVLISVWLPITLAMAEWHGGGSIGIGYTFLDQTGDRSVSQETYDLYEDPGFSIRNFRLESSGHYELTGNLENINLDNRNIYLRFRRPGRVSISGQHQKSRRIYDFDGRQRTYRDRSAFDIALIPHRAVKLLGGYAQSGREGSFLLFGGQPFSGLGEGLGSDEPAEVLSDYSMTAYYFGAQLRHRKSMIEGRYRHTGFTDDLDGNQDRQGQYVRVHAFTPVPRVGRMIFTGGFLTGWNEVESRDEKRKKNSFWGGLTWTVQPAWILSYKLLLSRIDNEAEGIETDNAVSTLFLTRRFPAKAEISLGYEFRSQDDLTDRTETNAFVVKGAARPTENVRLKGQFAFSREEDDDRTTLVGSEEITRYRCEFRYDHPAGHGLTLRYRDRRRDFADIGSKADFKTISSTLTFSLLGWGQGFGTYAYSNGDYANTSSTFRFEQHVATARVTTKRCRRLRLTSGLTYLRSRRHIDIEKIIFSVGVNVGLTRGYQFNARYNAFNYDDFMVIDRYYTANAVAVDIQKELNF